MMNSVSRAVLAGALASAPLAAAGAAHAQATEGSVDALTVVGGLTTPLTATSTGTRLGLTPLETPASVQVIRPKRCSRFITCPQSLPRAFLQAARLPIVT